MRDTWDTFLVSILNVNDAYNFRNNLLRVREIAKETRGRGGHQAGQVRLQFFSHSSSRYSALYCHKNFSTLDKISLFANIYQTMLFNTAHIFHPLYCTTYEYHTESYTLCFGKSGAIMFIEFWQPFTCFTLIIGRNRSSGCELSSIYSGE